MTQAKDYNTTKIFEILAQIAFNDANIYQFSYGTDWESNQNIDLKYPLLFCEYPSVLIKERTKIFNISLMILDRALEEAPGQRIANDSLGATPAFIITKTEEIMTDLIATLWNQYKLYLPITTEFNIIPFTEQFADRVYGWRLQFDFIVPRGINPCQTVQLSNGIYQNFIIPL